VTKLEGEASEPEASIGSVIVLALFTLAFGAGGHVAMSTSADIQEFADEAVLGEAQVHQVEAWVSGGDQPTWLYKATLAFTTEDGAAISGEKAIDRGTFTRLSREGTAQSTHVLSKRERFAIEPGRATMPIFYLPTDPQRFETEIEETGSGAMRIIGYAMFVLSAVLGFVTAVLAVMLIAETRQRRRSRALPRSVDERPS
jgi:hypothetical protein